MSSFFTSSHFDPSAYGAQLGLGLESASSVAEASSLGSGLDNELNASAADLSRDIEDHQLTRDELARDLQRRSMEVAESMRASGISTARVPRQMAEVYESPGRRRGRSPQPAHRQAEESSRSGHGDHEEHGARHVPESNKPHSPHTSSTGSYEDDQAHQELLGIASRLGRMRSHGRGYASPGGTGSPRSRSGPRSHRAGSASVAGGGGAESAGGRARRSRSGVPSASGSFGLGHSMLEPEIDLLADVSPNRDLADTPSPLLQLPHPPAHPGLPELPAYEPYRPTASRATRASLSPGATPAPVYGRRPPSPLPAREAVLEFRSPSRPQVRRESPDQGFAPPVDAYSHSRGPKQVAVSVGVSAGAALSGSRRSEDESLRHGTGNSGPASVAGSGKGLAHSGNGESSSNGPGPARKDSRPSTYQYSAAEYAGGHGEAGADGSGYGSGYGYGYGSHSGSGHGPWSNAYGNDGDGWKSNPVGSEAPSGSQPFGPAAAHVQGPWSAIPSTSPYFHPTLSSSSAVPGPPGVPASSAAAATTHGNYGGLSGPDPRASAYPPYSAGYGSSHPSAPPIPWDDYGQYCDGTPQVPPVGGPTPPTYVNPWASGAYPPVVGDPYGNPLHWSAPPFPGYHDPRAAQVAGYRGGAAVSQALPTSNSMADVRETNGAHTELLVGGKRHSKRPETHLHFHSHSLSSDSMESGDQAPPGRPKRRSQIRRRKSLHRAEAPRRRSSSRRSLSGGEWLRKQRRALHRLLRRRSAGGVEVAWSDGEGSDARLRQRPRWVSHRRRGSRRAKSSDPTKRRGRGLPLGSAGPQDVHAGRIGQSVYSPDREGGDGYPAAVRPASPLFQDEEKGGPVRDRDPYAARAFGIAHPSRIPDEEFLEASRSERLSMKMRQSQRDLDHTIEQLDRRTRIAAEAADEVAEERTALQASSNRVHALSRRLDEAAQLHEEERQLREMESLKVQHAEDLLKKEQEYRQEIEAIAQAEQARFRADARQREAMYAEEIRKWKESGLQSERMLQSVDQQRASAEAKAKAIESLLAEVQAQAQQSEIQNQRIIEKLKLRNKAIEQAQQQIAALVAARDRLCSEIEDLNSRLDNAKVDAERSRQQIAAECNVLAHTMAAATSASLASERVAAATKDQARQARIQRLEKEKAQRERQLLVMNRNLTQSQIALQSAQATAQHATALHAAQVSADRARQAYLIEQLEAKTSGGRLD